MSFVEAKAQRDDRPLQRFLTYRLAMLNTRLTRQGGAILQREGGLKIPEWRVLSLLVMRGPLNGREIGDLMGMDVGLISRTFRALEVRGLIVMARPDADRRIARATLTDQGLALYEKVLPAMRRRQEALLGALTPSERQLVFKIIDKLDVAAAVAPENVP